MGLCKFRDTLLVQSPCQKCALTPGLPSFTSDEDLIDTVLKKGYFFAIPYNGGYTTGDEILLIPDDVLSRTAKFFR